MTDAASYSHRDTLRDGTPVEIRALRPEDAVEMLAALGQTSAQSRRRRFFIPKQHFSDRERDFFMEIDFVQHVALVACVDDAGCSSIVGGGRYVVTEPGKAEIAFMVVDDYHGQGVGTLLMRHLAIVARKAGLKELVAEVLPENIAMRKVFGKFGFQPRRGNDPQVVHLVLSL